LLALLTVSVLVMTSGVEANPPVASGCDFNHDGFDDLAVGVPGENVGSAANAGAVNVIYGSATGLHATGNQLWHQDRASVEGFAQDGDRFGAALACGDFNVDQFDDLAIGVPGDDVLHNVDAGAVNVLYGSESGLTAAGNERWHQNSPSVQGTPEAGDRFGAALASGDFNDDVADDLAIGVPGENLGSADLGNEGAVNVLYGHDGGGLSAAGNQVWSQDSPSVIGTAEHDEEFGAALAAGDFDNDNFDDLAIGVPGQDLVIPGGTSQSDAGAVNVLHGSAAGLAASRDQFWSQVVLEGNHEEGDRFGHSLATGDFNNDGFDDLAVGVPGENLGESASAGAVNVLYGSAALLTLSGNQVWHQDSPSLAGVAEEADGYGAALAVADFDDDGFDDLAAGIPSEDVGTTANAGAAQVLFGAAAGLSGVGSQLWHQNSASVEGVAEPGNAFGSSLAAGNFDGDRYGDLVAGVPGEAIGGITSAGAVNVLYGSGNGPSGAGDQLWHQDSPGILGAIEHYDRLGDQPLTSNGVYRIAYVSGTSVRVTGDHFSHGPDLNEIDMHGEPDDNNEQYTVVAAADGTIMAIEDSYPPGQEDDNNYVWIAHANGEWTKYTHLETGSVTGEGRFVGEFVSAGTDLGFEGEVGADGRVHTHFEVVVPDDPANAITAGGFIIGQSRVPLICGIAGNVLYDGQTYVAGPC
jgi:hypothetical protein